MVPAARKSPAWPKRAAQPHGGTSDARPGLSEPITFESYSDKTEASPEKEPTKFHVVNAERKTKRWPGRKPASAAVKRERGERGHPERPKHRPRGPSPTGGHRPDVAPCPRGRPYSLCLQKFMISSRNPLPPPPQNRAPLGRDACNNRAWPTLRPQTRRFASSGDRERGGTGPDPAARCPRTAGLGKEIQRTRVSKRKTAQLFIYSHTKRHSALLRRAQRCARAETERFQKAGGKKKRGRGSERAPAPRSAAPIAPVPKRARAARGSPRAQARRRHDATAGAGNGGGAARPPRAPPGTEQQVFKP